MNQKTHYIRVKDGHGVKQISITAEEKVEVEKSVESPRDHPFLTIQGVMYKTYNIEEVGKIKKPKVELQSMTPYLNNNAGLALRKKHPKEWKQAYAEAKEWSEREIEKHPVGMKMLFGANIGEKIFRARAWTFFKMHLNLTT